jgi:succinate dehydrogenase / fumarate reductase cytochrome b subunit
MNWLVRACSTSVGKKQLMAVTGMLFLVFLGTHLLGNLSIYGGPEAFNAYAHGLHQLGKILVVAEIGLVVCLAIHVFLAVLLWLENRRARPVPYAVDKSGGNGRTFSSVTMPYTGLFILVFVIVHLAGMSHHIVDQSRRTIFQIAGSLFASPLILGFYVFSMIVVALHVRHGLWSAFQSVGLNHPKYMPFIRGLSLAYAILVGVGFGMLPVVIRFMS